MKPRFNIICLSFMQPLVFPAINRSEEESRKNGINPGTEEDRTLKKKSGREMCKKGN